MPTVQQWGRKESIIWPPRGYLHTLDALFFEERKMDDLIVPSTPLLSEAEEIQGNLLSPEYALQPPEDQIE